MRHDHEGLCAMCPVEPGHEGELLALLEGLDGEAESPFARVPGTHFGRLTFVPHLQDSRGDQLGPTAFLLLATEFDGTTEDHLRALVEGLGGLTDELLGHLEGQPDSFGDHLLAHRVDPGYSAAGYPGVSVEEVRRALRLRKRVTEFALEAQGLEPAELRERWKRRFKGKWR